MVKVQTIMDANYLVEDALIQGQAVATASC